MNGAGQVTRAILSTLVMGVFFVECPFLLEGGMCMSETVSLVSHGVDTLILNVRYCDEQFHPVKQELADDLVRVLDSLQVAARQHDEAVASPWSFLGVALFVEPHGAGKQWRWLLTSRLLTL